jgi:SecD/SecF fusion protein
LFGLVSIYQLSFTFKNNSIESDAKAIANTDTVKETQYLDSLSNQEVYNLGIAKYTYNEVKENAMNLGLDLKGGVNVILQVSVKDILKGLANNTLDPTFNKALDDASELQKDGQNTYLEDFFTA